MEKTNKGAMVLIIGMLGVLLLLIVGFIAYLFLFVVPTLGGNAEATEPPVVHSGLELKDIYPIELDEMTVNLAPGADGKAHYLLTAVVVEINNSHPDDDATKEIIELAESHKYRFKDAVIAVCANLTKDDLLKPDGQVMFKEELKTEFSNIFSSNLIYNVGFSKWNPQ